MKLKKRIIPVMFTCMFFFSGTGFASANTNTNALNNIQQEIEQSVEEKQTVQREINTIQQEMEEMNTYISENKKEAAITLKRIEDTNKLIEEKKENIVFLEDKIYSRKDIMSQRLVALQHDQSLDMVLQVLFSAKDFDDFIGRAVAVTTLLNADNNILEEQQADLKQIEEEKKEIQKQQQLLEEDQKSLAKKQEELNQNLKRRQDNFIQLQEKYNQINQKMALAEKEKASIEAQIKATQEKIRIEQEEAKRKAATPVNSQVVQTKSSIPESGNELYVTATAYSPDESGSITALGYNIDQNPNMKLIAVDPNLIPLGSKVWVEGYGEAIAGDTGSAIVGHKIDVLMPTKAAALSWGRKTVKIVILD